MERKDFDEAINAIIKIASIINEDCSSHFHYCPVSDLGIAIGMEKQIIKNLKDVIKNLNYLWEYLQTI